MHVNFCDVNECKWLMAGFNISTKSTFTSLSLSNKHFSGYIAEQLIVKYHCMSAECVKFTKKKKRTKLIVCRAHREREVTSNGDLLKVYMPSNLDCKEIINAIIAERSFRL